MATFASVKTKLKAILDTLTGGGQPLQVAYSWPNPAPRAFPCATISVLEGSSEKRFDTATNEVKMRFAIRVFIRAINTQANYDLRDTIADQIMDAIRTSGDTLGGTVDIFDIESISFLEATVDEQEIASLQFEMIVVATSIKDAAG